MKLFVNQVTVSNVYTTIIKIAIEQYSRSFLFIVKHCKYIRLNLNGMKMKQYYKAIQILNKKKTIILKAEKFYIYESLLTLCILYNFVITNFKSGMIVWKWLKTSPSHTFETSKKYDKTIFYKILIY